jgi:hypothetical protein
METESTTGTELDEVHETKTPDPEGESRRLADLLLRLIRLSGRSVRSIEQELRVGSSGVGKVLKGTIRLQVSHIVMICNALKITPAQFFQLAYRQREPTTPLIEEYERIEKAGARNEALSDRRQAEKLVRKVLRDIFASLFAPEELPPSPETTAPQETE